MSIAVIGIYLVFALAGLGLLGILVFGIRSIVFGKISPIAIAILALPVVLLVILGLVLGEWDYAAILTVFITLGLALVALLLTGIKGMFT